MVYLFIWSKGGLGRARKHTWSTAPQGAKHIPTCFVPLNIIQVNLNASRHTARSQTSSPHWPVSQATVAQQKFEFANAVCEEFDLPPCGMSLRVLPSLQFEYTSCHGAAHAVRARTLTLRPGALISNDPRRSPQSVVWAGMLRILKWLRRGYRFPSEEPAPRCTGSSLN